MTSLSTLSVLVVDDEASVVTQLVEGLTLAGFQASGASSALAALDCLAHDSSIGVVLTDIRMPGLDGIALAKRVACGRDEVQATEVIVITGNATVEDATNAVRSQVSDFLRKPFRLSEASHAVGAALGRAASRRQNAMLTMAQNARILSLEAEGRALQGELADAARQLSAAAGPTEINRSLQRDLQAISHALRTPLNSIAGGTYLLGAPSPARGSLDHLELLRSGVDQAREAVELVEELHRVDALPEGQQRSCALHERIARAGVLVSRRAQEGSIILDLTKVTPVTVNGVCDRLQRAIELCLATALDWAPAGTSVSVVLEPVETSGTTLARWAVLTILVAPAGMAKPPEPPSEIAFVETTSLLSRTQEGLRFSIARRLAEQHGGVLTSWNGSDRAMALRLALPL